MAFFKKKIQDEPEMRVFGKTEFLIVGLGNPGKEYEMSRHNAGFLTLDILSNELGFRTDKVKFKALTADVMIGNHRCLVMRPQTYMNNSGEAVKEAVDFYKIPYENVIVIYDDIDLAVGALRIRRKGSAGGHNGIKSIIYHLGSDNFPRMKIGVGAKPSPDYDLADYVLGKFSKEDSDTIKVAMKSACNAVKYIVDGDIEKAMTECQITVKKQTV